MGLLLSVSLSKTMMITRQQLFSFETYHFSLQVKQNRCIYKSTKQTQTSRSLRCFLSVTDCYSKKHCVHMPLSSTHKSLVASGKFLHWCLHSHVFYLASPCFLFLHTAPEWLTKHRCCMKVKRRI